MRKVLLMLVFLLTSVCLSAQDFVNRFLEHRDSDTNLKCVSISPKMIREVIEMGEEWGDEGFFDMIANLKSMQVVTSEVEGKTYYEEAVDLLEKNAERFEPFGSYCGHEEVFRIMIRRKKGQIVELVMLVNENNRFAVVDFTGNITDQFIDRIAEKFKEMRS